MTGFDPDALATGLLHIGPDGRIRHINRAAAEMTGRTAREITGRALADVAYDLDDWYQRVIRSQRALSIPETPLAGALVDILLHPVDDGVLIELSPVADRVRQREMAERADRQQAVSTLARRLAHELRNPLAGIRGGAQLIAGSAGDSDAGRHAMMIQREVDRMIGLIERFVDEGSGEFAPANLHRVLTEAAELASAEARGQTVIERDFDPSIPDISADGHQLHQMFLNLMRNALQAGATEIRLTTRIEHHCALLDEAGRHAIRIDVDDNGVGVPENLRERLFLPLVSGRDGGSGFGLAIVQQMARVHGGLVEYQPLDSGSRFCVRLPLVSAEQDAA